jgi:DtxR family Mn-dependent transcriptional regulator
MPDSSLFTGAVWFALILAVALLAWGLLPRGPVSKYLRRRHRLQERAAFEDILRQILQMQQDGKAATVEALSGILGKPVPLMRRTIGRMTDRELLSVENQTVLLTREGHRWAMHVLRAHRLWESYLADEARLPMTRLHTQAEREEHRLSESDLAALDAQLGHPAEDPHGDPIPTAEGELARPRGTALPQWQGSEFVQVVHVEDEPEDIFKRLLSKGIRPGVSLRLESLGSGYLEAVVDGVPVSLDQDLLPNVEVEEDRAALTSDPQITRLSQLPTGESAEIVALSDTIRGFSRRRLLDFGVTRGTRIAPILNNPFGDPRAFRVRGTTIGIREEQAREIWVRRISTASFAEGQTS